MTLELIDGLPPIPEPESDEPVRVPSVEEIIKVVCARFKLTRAALLSHRRYAELVRPRQVVMYLARTLTLRSMPDIGRRLAGRDHTTVLSGYRRIVALRQIDPTLDATLIELEAQLRA